jgi:hypothetical protein
MSRCIALWAASFLVLLSACGSVGSSPGGQPAADLTLHDQDNGRSITVQSGAHVTFVLGSTYWQFQDSSDPSVLRLTSTPQASPNHACVPGGGCGTVTVGFDAVHAGQADVSARRTSCGEAMACTGGPGHESAYKVTVVVTG